MMSMAGMIFISEASFDGSFQYFESGVPGLFWMELDADDAVLLDNSRHISTVSAGGDDVFCLRDHIAVDEINIPAVQELAFAVQRIPAEVGDGERCIDSLDMSFQQTETFLISFGT